VTLPGEDADVACCPSHNVIDPDSSYHLKTELEGVVFDRGATELIKWAASRTLPAGDVFREQLILALAEGQTHSHIMASLGTTAPTISRWKQRFEQDGLAGLDAREPAARGQRGGPSQDRAKNTTEADRRFHPLVLP
jgi:hypothetical protein